MAEFLIKNGANVNAADKRGTTPLSMAADSKSNFFLKWYRLIILFVEKYLEVAQLLINNGANAKTPLLYTAVHSKSIYT